MAHPSYRSLVVDCARVKVPILFFGACALLFSALVLSSGCGHPASVAECEEIVERITRLELEQRQISKDPNAVAAEVAETKTAMRERMMKDCHGKRVTNRAMRCVREATSSKKVEECFD